MKNLLPLLGMLCTICTVAHAQSPPFTEVLSPRLNDPARIVSPIQAKFFRVDTALLREFLHTAPAQTATTEPAQSSDYVFELPDPNGDISRFRILRYEMMEPALSAEFPEIVTALGVDVDQPTRRIRLDWTYRGFHASVQGDPNGRWFVEPLFRGRKAEYQVYYTHHYPFNPDLNHECGTENREQRAAFFQPKRVGDCELRTYRLAMATTGEYYNFHGTTDAEVLSEVTTAINRVNQVTELDLAIRLLLIGNTTDVFYSNPATDPYTNNSGSAMLGQNQATLNSVIGVGNYDVGHVFSTGGGGIAALGSVCFSNAKARGVTGLPAPVGDPFYIDFVAHELGHQFGGNHTFNSLNGNCTQRNGSTAYEPGSGTTIQAYAGICGFISNVQLNSDPYYHAVSIVEMANFMESGVGDFCAQNPQVSNTAPTVDAGSDVTIPLGTPFILTATGSDPDGDALTYCWEQYDLGTALDEEPTGMETSGPIIRSLTPTSSPSRTIDGAIAWEAVPLVARTLTFRVTARDINTNFGCTVQDEKIVTVANVGPFEVTVPNGGETLMANAVETITWDVAGTDANGINCSDVTIELSLDGGDSYTTLLASTPNDGSADVSIPDVSETDARIRIRCNTNIFYDISDNNFVIAREEFSVTPVTSTIGSCEGDDPIDGLSFTLTSEFGYTGSISLSTTGLPSGVTAQFNPQSPVNLAANASENVAVSLTGTASLAPGTYNFTVLADDGNRVEMIPLSLEVGAGGIAVNSPENGLVIPIGASGDNGIVPLSYVQAPGQTYTITISGFNPLNLGTANNVNLNLGSVNDGDTFTWFLTAAPSGDVSCPRTFSFGILLPVEWIDFQARRVEGSNLLEWEVIQDGRGLDYTIERRQEGARDFTGAGLLPDSRVEGRATYTFVDSEVEAGSTYFYRIKQRDLDGAVSYSPIRSVRGQQDGKAAAILIIPNPTESLAWIELPQSLVGAFHRYSIIGPLGQELLAGAIGGMRIEIDVTTLPSGVYQVVLRGDHHQRSVRLVRN